MKTSDKWVIAVCIVALLLLISTATLVISAVVNNVSVPAQFNSWIDSIKDWWFTIKDWVVDTYNTVKDWFVDLFTKSETVETVAKIK